MPGEHAKYWRVQADFWLEGEGGANNKKAPAQAGAFKRINPAPYRASLFHIISLVRLWQRRR
jgi:hypothetical protein